MYFSLRTTIFWNMFILMVAAIVLISLVVFRVTEREIFKQHTRSGKMMFSSIEAGLSSWLLHHPDSLDAPPVATELQGYLNRFVKDGICRSIVLVNNNNIVISPAEKNTAGRHIVDKDIQQAMILKSIVTRLYAGAEVAGQHLSVAGPVYLQGKEAGYLKAVFSLQDVQESAERSLTMILLYVVLDAVILIALGFFLLSRYLVTPIKKLTRLTETIGDGNLNGLPLFLSEKNEIGKLSTALTTMAEKLTQERAKIKEQLQALEEKNLALQQARREIIQTEKLASVGRLAAGIAHEIGNPVGIILGYIHMLRRSDVDEKERGDYLRRIESETERVNAIIRDLLDYAQPSSREAQDVNLNALIKDACALVSYQREFKDIAIIYNLVDGLPPLHVNEKLLRQIIINLVLNARDAIAGSGGTLTFATALDTTDKEDRISLTIADTGGGIPLEHQDKIFDPFFTTKEQGKGTGLGLSNVHRIVELSGGAITFSSIPGEGTMFRITFPAERPTNVIRET